jgi:hypothetical protein
MLTQVPSQPSAVISPDGVMVTVTTVRYEEPGGEPAWTRDSTATGEFTAAILKALTERLDRWALHQVAGKVLARRPENDQPIEYEGLWEGETRHLMILVLPVIDGKVIECDDVPVSASETSRQQLLADILIGAVEGGTGYWATVSAYHHSGAPAGTSATLHEIEPGDDEHPKGREVTTETIEAGIHKILDPYFRICTHLRAAITHAHRQGDAGAIDAEAADAIVQAGLFGEIVYG